MSDVLTIATFLGYLGEVDVAGRGRRRLGRPTQRWAINAARRRWVSS